MTNSVSFELDATPKKAPETKKRKLDQKEAKSSEPASKRIILDKSRKYEDTWDEQLSQTLLDEAPSTSSSRIKFDAALVGSSMIRGIDPYDVLPDKNVLFSSISGGRITDLLNYLITQEPYLKSCRLFIITIGSNDCDSHATMVKIYKDLNELVYYLDDKFPKARVLMNLLVPRPVCRYTKPDEFESRRKSFNEYVRVSLPNQLKNVVLSYIPHPSFEVDPQESEGQKILADLLHDGVHISTDYGVAKYVAEINDALKDLYA